MNELNLDEPNVSRRGLLHRGARSPRRHYFSLRLQPLRRSPKPAPWRSRSMFSGHKTNLLYMHGEDSLYFPIFRFWRKAAMAASNPNQLSEIHEGPLVGRWVSEFATIARWRALSQSTGEGLSI